MLKFQCLFFEIIRQCFLSSILFFFKFYRMIFYLHALSVDIHYKSYIDKITAHTGTLKSCLSTN